MRQPTDGWLERDGVRLHYLEWETPDVPIGPSILLLHGLSSNSRYWTRVAGHLAARRRVVALDQRAHGLTGRAGRELKVPDGFAMAELIEDVSFAVVELGLGQPVVAGHSWGATVALEAVGTRPALASGLVFVDGPVQSASSLFSWDEAQLIMQPPLPRFADLDEAIAESRNDFGSAWGEDLEPFVDARVMPDAGELILTLSAPARLELLKGLYESQPEILWPLVDVPAAALLATRSFARISRSTQTGVASLEKIAPHVRVRWFDTPHDIPLYMPLEVASEIERIAGLAAETVASEPSAG
ncbi:MAG TPA: alpha/beta fold hydrolase [Patescibacteria group bacterium]|nr:alpha/beta fold hydrolase [Patescibacteria group bacterium]